MMWGDSLTAGAASYVNYYSPYDVVNGGVSGETSTQILARVIALPEAKGYPTIIWAGRNDIGTPTTVKANIASIIANLTTTNYVVLSVLNQSTEPSGNATYNTIIQLNLDLAALYGAKYYDLRAYLVSQFDAGTPQDVIDHGNDVVPSTLRSDALHLNVTGYAKAGAMIAPKLA
jgi:lysophospholipase L1-like esterase